MFDKHKKWLEENSEQSKTKLIEKYIGYAECQALCKSSRFCDGDNSNSKSESINAALERRGVGTGMTMEVLLETLINFVSSRKWEDVKQSTKDVKGLEVWLKQLPPYIAEKWLIEREESVYNQIP